MKDLFGLQVDPAEFERLPAPAQDQVRAYFEQMGTFLEANPLLGYNNPHMLVNLRQMLFHRARTKLKGLVAGNRTGKTMGGIADDLIQALDRDMVPEHLIDCKRWDPPFYCRIVSPDLTRSLEGVIFQWLRKLCPKSQLAGGSFDRAFDKTQRVLHFTNGSWIDFFSTDQDPDKYQGVKLHRVHWDEEPIGPQVEAIFGECLTRLLDLDGDMIFTMTPKLGLALIHNVLWEPVQAHEVGDRVWSNGRITVVNADMDDNPFLSAEAKAEYLEVYKFTEEELAARKSGKFVHYKGLVYPEFDYDRHTIPQPEPEVLKGMTIYVGIDPGIQTTGVSFAAFDGDNHMLVFDELYLHDNDAIPDNVAHRIRAKMKRWEITTAKFVIDPHVRVRELTTAEQVQTAYYRAGIHARPGQADPQAGVFEIKRRLEHGLYTIARNCEHHLWERRRYRRDDRDDGRFAVVKEDDHLMDADRYIACERPTAPKTRSRARGQRRQWIPGTAPPMQPRVRGETPPLGAMS